MKFFGALISLMLLAGCGEKSGDGAPTGSNKDGGARTIEPRQTGNPGVSGVKSQTIEYATINNRRIQGYLAYPSAAEGGLPGVLVFHGRSGPDAHIRSMADQLAAQGYVALAVDLSDGPVAAQPGTASGSSRKALADEAVGEHVRQAHAYLRDQVKATRVGTIGWGLGGTVSLRAGVLLADQVDAVVIYYGALDGDVAGLEGLRAPVLGLYGGADESVPAESVRAFESALKRRGKPAQIHFYEGAPHGFAEAAGDGYRADAAADAWQKVLEFLAQRLKDG